MRTKCITILALAALAIATPHDAFAQNTRPKTSYLWHLHQPIYWNDQKASGDDRYEYARETIDAKAGGRAYPLNDVSDIFGLDDREAAYQYRPAASLFSMAGGSRAGAQLTYSGALLENVGSLGATNWGSYTANWWHGMRDGFLAKTPGGHPRLDTVNFSFHHALLPLHDAETAYMEIKLHQEKMKEILGGGYTLSKGIFPTEMAFSERLIPIFKRAGIDWTVVSGEKIARACADFPLVLGSGGVNCAPPNRADQINPDGVEFIRRSISRGCSPVNANPLSYQVAHAKYVNPATGAVETILVVPADQSSGWEDGYGCFSPGFLGALTARNNPANPSLALLAHDGDNAFGGGYSYYMECVPNYTSTSVNNNFDITTVQQFLTDFPAARQTIHVEDGAWVNADGDFGSPMFINWNYPLLNASGQHDPANGWHEKPREYAIWMATANRVLTAQQISGHAPNFSKILHPDAATHAVDRAWHYYLGSLDSGNQYYGDVLDLEVKPTLGCNEAVQHADLAIGSGAGDTTPPSVWIPQRFPYNPGSLNFGVEFQYQQNFNDGDFWVWTFAYDVHGPATCVLKFREDVDGVNPLTTNQNETFAGGAEVGAWQSLPMSRRVFPSANIYSKPGLNYYELPTYIADHYSATIVGVRSKLLDYYIESTDTLGNVTSSEIQHVWVGDGSGSTGTGTTRVEISPDPPDADALLTIDYDATGSPLAGAPVVKIHLGKNNWSGLISPDPTMTANGANKWQYTYTVDADASSVEMVFNNGSGTWDNNGGQDWKYATTGPVGPGGGGETSATSPWTMDGIIDADACASGGGLWYGEKQGWVYIATNAATPNDAFLYAAEVPGAPIAANWAKGGQVAAWDFFLAREGSNAFAGWFGASGSLLGADTAQRVLARNGAVLEGALRKDLIAATGQLSVAMGVFGTADGGALVSQFPASLDANANIEATEFLAIHNGPNPSGAISFTPSLADIALSWTAPANAPLGFLVLRVAGGTPPADVPINGNAYPVGTLIGSSRVVHNGAAASFVDSPPVGGTFSYAIYSYNGAPTGCVQYRIAAPLVGTSSTTRVAEWQDF